MLSLKPDEIYTIAIINKPQKTVAQFDTNIDSTTTAVADNAKFDMQKTTRHAEGNMEVLDVTDIYTAHFRTSSYSTFSEKMDGFEVTQTLASQVLPYVHNLKTNVTDYSNPIENLDFADYKNNSFDGNVKIEPIYSEIPWYVENVEFWMYENLDLQSIVGKIHPPINSGIIYWYNSSSFTELDEYAIETNGRLNSNRESCINNHMQEYINKDFHNFRLIVANKLVNETERSEGIIMFMKANNIPPTTSGAYPILFKYVLPGKNKNTSKYKMSINL